MAKKQMAWKTKGMNRDLSVSAFNPEFAFENRNLRLSTNENNTLLSWVNERGTAALLLKKDEHWTKSGKDVYVEPSDSGWTHYDAGEVDLSITGVTVGTAIINHQLILFTYDSILNTSNYIYKLKYADSNKDTLLGTPLFNGNIEIDVDHPLETLVSYESENVQKVYWVDGKNQPRVINICNVYDTNSGDYNPFDFVSVLQLKEEVKIRKILGASGLFAPGVIQYALTYYNKNGQESNIFYTSPLQYISFRDRGASPEDKVENAFEIKVSKPDKNFDYLRIYSIQRTSINGTPICKRIQDIDISSVSSSDTVSYTDNGISGDSVDPTELLYKGGEEIIVHTLAQKDNTIFLGNIELTTPVLADYLKDAAKSVSIEQSTRTFSPTRVSYSNSNSGYSYCNQLTSYNQGGNSVPCGGFKRGETYRLGVQLQYKTGKWSEPILLNNMDPKHPNTHNDFIVKNKPTEDSSGNITIPIFKGTMSVTSSALLLNAGYKKVRAVVVFPQLQDRSILCQGVINPTMFTDKQWDEKSQFAQSSWFFRFRGQASVDIQSADAGTGGVFPFGYFEEERLISRLPYTSNKTSTSFESSYNPDTNIRFVEIQGQYDSTNMFWIQRNFCTMHSPDVEFDDQLSLLNYSGVGSKKVGEATLAGVMSDIDIQTETPTISNGGAGFVHKAFSTNKYGIVSGLFYEDWVVEDWGEKNDLSDVLTRLESERSPVKWMVYLWNKSGSLNNDINRPSDKGTATAVLKKKVISNLRYATTTLNSSIEYDTTGTFGTDTPQIFSGDEVSILRFSSGLYKGNIDTMLTPDAADGMYFAFDGDDTGEVNVQTSFVQTKRWWKTYSNLPNEAYEAGLWKKVDGGGWTRNEGDSETIGNQYVDLVTKRDPVRMKYKSTPHLVFRTSLTDCDDNCLPIVELTQNPGSSRFGGSTVDALRENIWVPCGEPVSLSTSGNTYFYYSYGDTYYQRWDCLKTYAFTREDTNQVVEIGSFMLETRVNIDGRYDRNRGQQNNLNMSPQNFNLLNPVYSQVDNFFSYRIMPEDYYKNREFPNQITWSKTKESGADVDLWTNVTLASILELDGDKGKVNKLIRFNDQLLCFQDTGISQILYNENVQIESTQGVPIEIANSGKVQGKRYLSNTIGCSNKWSMTQTPSGIYFMDSNDKSIYLFSGQLQNISNAGGFSSWSKTNISLTGKQWTPDFVSGDFVAHYDKLNQDVLFINKEYALAWSEKLQAFTSFYDYGDTPFFCNLDDTGIWVKNRHIPEVIYETNASDISIYADGPSYYIPESKAFMLPCVNPEGYVLNYSENADGMKYCCSFGYRKNPMEGGFDGYDWNFILVYTNLTLDGVLDKMKLYYEDEPPHCVMVWVEDTTIPVGATMSLVILNNIPLWKHQGGESYCNFFGYNYPYSMTLVGNPEPQTDKIFTNLEFRACVDGDGYSSAGETRYNPYLPFNTLETWNEYQHGIAKLETKFGHDLFKHHSKSTIDSSVIRKFRIWRCDIPRSNAALALDEGMNIYRKDVRSQDRMRNPWLYLKLMRSAEVEGNEMHRAEIHDLIMTYYG